ncbi:MAG: mechanosensitive ion channel [Azospirillaceae bacterium]
MAGRLCAGIVALILLVLASGAAPAQVPGLTSDEAAETPAAPGPSNLQLLTLLDLLDDPEVRAWLRTQVEEGPAATGTLAGDAVMASPLPTLIAAIEERAAGIVADIEAVDNDLDRTVTILSFELDGGEWAHVLLFIVVFMAIGVAVEWAFWRASRGVRLAIVNAPMVVPGDRVRMNALRFVFAVLSVAAFALGSIGAFALFDWTPIIEVLTLTYLNVFLVYRLAHAFGRFAYAPWVESLRLVPMPTSYALFLFRWTNAVVVVFCFFMFTGGALRELGLAPSLVRMLTFANGLFLVAILIAALWRGAAVRRKAGEIEARPALARARRALRSALLIVMWLAWVMDFIVPAMVLLVLVFLPPALRICDQAAIGMARRPGTAADSEEARLARQNLWVILIGRGARAILLLIAAGLLITAYNTDPGFVMQEEPLGETLVRAIFTTLIAYVIADAVWQAAKTAIYKRMEVEGALQADTRGDEGGGGAAHSRLGTLLPLLRNFLLVFLVVIVMMIGLSAFGIDIGPLLAGAGVVGIAIGFGAQALVRDIFSGVFFLLDDAFRIGEYVEIDQLRGTVEAISIRSMRLRHHRGAIHTVPFGEIRSITNYSRDWVIMKLEFRVPFETDLAVVKRLVKRIGNELAADPLLGPSLIEPLKSQGVRRIEEFNMVLGVKFMAKPGEQFLIRREVYQRILKAFEDNGIELASRDVKVRIPPGVDRDDPSVSSAAAVAAEGSPTPQAGTG